MEKWWKQWKTLFSWAPKLLQMVTAAMKLKDACSLEEKLDSIKKQRHYLPTKVHLVKAMVFQVVMYGCESWTIKKAEHWRIGAFELWCWRRLLRVPWTARRSNSQSKEDQPWIFIGRTDAEALILWLPDGKGWIVVKDPHSGKDWRQKEKGVTEHEMVGWHHRLNGQDFERTQGRTGNTGVL